MHLAQLNVARLQHPLDAPETAEFVAALEPVNALADAAPGFVWRLQGEAGDATSIRALGDDLVIVNQSTWESIEALYAFGALAVSLGTGFRSSAVSSWTLPLGNVRSYATYAVLVWQLVVPLPEMVASVATTVNTFAHR